VERARQFEFVTDAELVGIAECPLSLRKWGVGRAAGESIAYLGMLGRLSIDDAQSLVERPRFNHRHGNQTPDVVTPQLLRRFPWPSPDRMRPLSRRQCPGRIAEQDLDA
jgi:hypothetical protein